MNLGVLIEGLKVQAVAGPRPDAVRICDITDDSRTVVPGSLFIARAGLKSDGRAYIPDALNAGAAAVLTDDPAVSMPARSGAAVVVSPEIASVSAILAERFYGSPTSALDLIGVTGTNGKTTTVHLVHQILNGAGVRCGLIGTVVIDDGVEVAPATMTTPPATELSRTFARMVESGCKAAVMETSSHALDQGRVAALHYDIAVFTNLTGDHLDYHKTMDAYAAAKARLLTMLAPDGWAIVNAEDPAAPRMLRECRARVLTCRVQDPESSPVEASDCLATVLSSTLNAMRLRMTGPWGTFEVTLRLIGRHNAMNALQAAAAAHAAGVQPRTLERRLALATAPSGRLEPVTGPADPFAVLVDYAHTDDAMRKVLLAAMPLVRKSGGKLSIVFGCGGDRDRTKRPRMGATAVELADRVYITSDNPRTERPSDIISEILAGVADRARVTIDADRAHAIQRAIADAQPGDIILIAGKGHEPCQIVSDGRGGTVSHHFDDREVAAAALAHRRHTT